MQCRFLEVGSPEWDRALARMAHDVYHLPAYARLSAELDRGAAMAFLAEEEGALYFVPLVVRPVPDYPGGYLDAISPYGYPGPLLHVPPDVPGLEDFLGRAVQEMLSALAARKVISVFVRLHTILTLPPEPFAQRGVLVDHGPTVSIDLTRPPEQIEREMRGNHRRQIRQLLRLGAAVHRDENWDGLPTFERAYEQTMGRVGAEDRYHFPSTYFVRLRDDLGAHIHLFLLRLYGRIAAGGIFTECGGIVQYHLGGTLDEFVNLNPMKLLLHSVSLWAQERGNRHHHLGGGVGAREDSLHHFKIGFAPARHVFRTWRAVSDPAAYGRLLQEWQRRRGRAPDGPERFFPAYRQE